MAKRFRTLLASLRRLIAAMRQGRTSLVPVGSREGGPEDDIGWDECFTLLEGILIPTDDYFWLRRRLKNGRGYFLAGESGAACYEVGMALRRVATLQQYCA